MALEGCALPDEGVMSTWKAYGCPPGAPRRELGDFPTRDLAVAMVGLYVAMTGYRSELEGLGRISSDGGRGAWSYSVAGLDAPLRSYMARSPRDRLLSMPALIDIDYWLSANVWRGWGYPPWLNEISSRGPPRL
jgi:hypothetical protein